MIYITSTKEYFPYYMIYKYNYKPEYLNIRPLYDKLIIVRCMIILIFKEINTQVLSIITPSNSYKIFFQCFCNNIYYAKKK